MLISKFLSMSMDKKLKVEEPVKPLVREEEVLPVVTPKEEKKEESRVIVDLARQV